MYNPSRGGVRGGADQFTWDSVKTDKHRENYLGHSLKAPVGRWQKGKDLSWYSKERKEGGEKSENSELAAIKRAEEEAMLIALGQNVIKKESQSLTKEEMAEALKRNVSERDELNIERIDGVGASSGRAALLAGGVRSSASTKEGVVFETHKNYNAVHENESQSHERSKSKKKSKKHKKEKKKQKDNDSEFDEFEKKASKHKKEKKKHKKNRNESESDREACDHKKEKIKRKRNPNDSDEELYKSRNEKTKLGKNQWGTNDSAHCVLKDRRERSSRKRMDSSDSENETSVKKQLKDERAIRNRHDSSDEEEERASKKKHKKEFENNSNSTKYKKSKQKTRNPTDSEDSDYHSRGAEKQRTKYQQIKRQRHDTSESD